MEGPRSTGGRRLEWSTCYRRRRSLGPPSGDLSFSLSPVCLFCWSVHPIRLETDLGLDQGNSSTFLLARPASCSAEVAISSRHVSRVRWSLYMYKSGPSSMMNNSQRFHFLIMAWSQFSSILKTHKKINCGDFLYKMLFDRNEKYIKKFREK